MTFLGDWWFVILVAAGSTVAGISFMSKHRRWRR
jgi:hypothetical protein